MKTERVGREKVLYITRDEGKAREISKAINKVSRYDVKTAYNFFFPTPDDKQYKVFTYAKVEKDYIQKLAGFAHGYSFAKFGE